MTTTSTDRVRSSIKGGVATITLNQPKQLNGWTLPMITAFQDAFTKATADPEVKAIVFTAVGRYFSAGVHLAGTLKLMHPRRLRALIIEHNQQLFETFLRCPKPLLVAVNGPAIGAAVTSATLCNGIIASESATFSTPFAALGIPPEGCSSVVFERLMGAERAQRMVGPAGWVPNAEEAKAVGLVQWVVPDEQLAEQAQAIAEAWVAQGEPRRYPADIELDELLAVNARESVDLANAFLAAPFLRHQAGFLWRKRKRGPAVMFVLLWALRPLWARWL